MEYWHWVCSRKLVGDRIKTEMKAPLWAVGGEHLVFFAVGYHGGRHCQQVQRGRAVVKFRVCRSTHTCQTEQAGLHALWHLPHTVLIDEGA